MTTLVCAVIQICYFADFNHRSSLTLSLFIVVLVFVDVEEKVFCVCACVCHNSESLITCDKWCCLLNDRNTPLEQAAGYEPRTKGKEPRANRNVKIKTVSAELLAVEDPSAGGWAGYL